MHPASESGLPSITGHVHARLLLSRVIPALGEAARLAAQMRMLLHNDEVIRTPHRPKSPHPTLPQTPPTIPCFTPTPTTPTPTTPTLSPPPYPPFTSTLTLHPHPHPTPPHPAPASLHLIHMTPPQALAAQAAAQLLPLLLQPPAVDLPAAPLHGLWREWEVATPPSAASRSFDTSELRNLLDIVCSDALELRIRVTAAQQLVRSTPSQSLPLRQPTLKAAAHIRQPLPYTAAICPLSSAFYPFSSHPILLYRNRSFSPPIVCYSSSHCAPIW